AAAGMGNVRVLEGGMGAWEGAGGAVRRGARRWDIERQVRLIAGAIVLAAVVVSIWVPAVRVLAGAVGLGLAVAALTDTCTRGMVLARLPYNRAASCDVDVVVAQLTGRV